MIKNPYLAGKIDGELLSGDISKEQAQILHKARVKNIPKCLGEYNPDIVDCQRQDLEICRLCKKIKGEINEVKKQRMYLCHNPG